MTFEDLLPMTLIRKARQYARQLWVRVVIMGLMSFVAIGLTQILETLVPKRISVMLGGGAADRLLDIIANAMLAVTIFSITVMVSVYQSSSSQFTPRVHRLIVQDRTTQNTMAVFIGAYVYALLAILMRELGVYTDDKAFALFVMTVAVLALIVVSLIRWVLHLQTFGRLTDTTRQIEEVTRAQFKDRLKNPCLGARALTSDVPEEAEVVRAPESGYIQHIFPEALNDAAAHYGVDVYLVQNIGAFVFLNQPLLRWVKKGQGKADPSDEGFEEALLEAVQLGDLRTYDQDPRFGLIVMGEVASKALSPGINDPGTAIDVITRVGRILSNYTDEAAQKRDKKLENLNVPPLDPDDLIEDGFAALARDGAAVVEVQQRLQDVLAGLMRHPDEGLAKAAERAAAQHLRRALGAIPFEPDRDRLMGSAAARVRERASG